MDLWFPFSNHSLNFSSNTTKEVAMSLTKCFIRFCRSKNVLMLVLLAANIYIAIQHMDSLYRLLIGILVGTLAYRTLERYFHVQMHIDDRSPFFMSHQLHHKDPTPENSCPEYWVFSFYFFVSLSIYLLDRPLLAGIWLGISHMLFWYEWIHFLCHCKYRPKTKYGMRIRKNHLRHHYKDSTTDYEMLYPKS